MTAPHYADGAVTLWHGDCVDVLRTMPDCSVDAVVTDPPYGLEFMGREWDSFRTDDPGTTRHRGDRAGAQGTKGSTDERWTGAGGRSMPSGRVNYGGPNRPRTNRCTGCGKRDQFRNPHTCPEGTPWQSEVIDPNSAPPTSLAFGAWCEEWAAECLRVLKPGGHLLAFGGTRTSHRLTCAIEDAGFEIRDTITWLYGSGFPKSLDVGKAIDKAAGAEREVVGTNEDYLRRKPNGMKTAGASAYGYSTTDYPTDARITAPATVDAARWQGWGTALKPASEPVVVARKPLTGTVAQTVLEYGTGALNIDACRVAGTRPDTTRGASANASSMAGPLGAQGRIIDDGAGRWPANVVLSHGDCRDECEPGCPVADLDAQSGEASYNPPAQWVGGTASTDGWGNIGKAEPGAIRGGYGDVGGASRFFPTFRYQAKADTTQRPRAGQIAHPTVKPLDLMRWLVRLVTPPGGTVLDLFAGSGTTGEACTLEGFRCWLVEREADYLPLIVDRLTRRSDPVAHLTAKARRGEPVDLGLFAHLDPEDIAHDRALAELQGREYVPWPEEEGA